MDKTHPILSRRLLYLFEISRFMQSTTRTKLPSFAPQIDFEKRGQNAKSGLPGRTCSAAATPAAFPDGCCLS